MDEDEKKISEWVAKAKDLFSNKNNGDGAGSKLSINFNLGGLLSGSKDKQDNQQEEQKKNTTMWIIGGLLIAVVIVTLLIKKRK